MKLICLTHKDNIYLARALQETKLLGVTLARNIKEFEFRKDQQDWVYKGSGKKVSRSRQVHLNKWLEDHKKFIEHERV